MDKMYLVNRDRRVALFVGYYKAFPGLRKDSPEEKWVEVFGPAKPFLVKPGEQNLPWSDGRGGWNPLWQGWLIYPGRHSLKPSKQWKRWPADDLSILGSLKKELP